MTNEELIAALSSAPVGTRELGVAVLEAIGYRRGGEFIDPGRGDWVERYWVNDEGDRLTFVNATEACVVTDLNFRLPGVPEGVWRIDGDINEWEAWLFPHGNEDQHCGRARTEALARCVVQLKATLATREKA